VPHVPAPLRRRVTARALDRCEYCLLSRASQETSFHIDHVVPMLAGGSTEADNYRRRDGPEPGVAIVPHGDLPRRPAAMALPPGCPAARWRSIGWLFLTGRGQYNAPVPVGTRRPKWPNARGMFMALSQPQPTSHIVRNPLVLGGEPTVAGTRVPVRSIVIAWELHQEVDRVCRAYPMLSRGDVDEALAFYDQHRDEIGRYIAENEDDDPEP